MRTLTQEDWTDDSGISHTNDICTNEAGTDFSLIKGLDAYRLIIDDCIRTLLGEIQLDLSLGIDYKGTVWSNANLLEDWKDSVRERIQNLSFVQTIDDIDAWMESEHTMKYQMTVTTDYGEVEVDND